MNFSLFCLQGVWPPQHLPTLCMPAGGSYLSILPGCSVPHWCSWACRQSLVHHCLQPGHSLSVWQTAGTSSPHQQQQVAQWLGLSWRRRMYMVMHRFDIRETNQSIPPQSHSRAWIQVPDFQLSVINDSKHCGPLWGPLDVPHCCLGGGET